jgi:osmotically-inducible protein OsmY
VTLTGTAGTAAEKDLAGRVAVSTQGVVGVINKIALTGRMDAATRAKAANARAEQPLSDSWITSKVNMSLMFTRGVESFHITVTTLDGVVSLNGVVDSTAERELAVRVTQDVRGVKKVEARGLTVG